MAILNGNCWLDGRWQFTHLYIENGVIARHDAHILPARTRYDAGGRRVIPGLIDSHVHFAMNAGQYVSADDFYSGGYAAAHGGVTTVIDFLDPYATTAELRKEHDRRLAQADACPIDYAFHSSVSSPTDGLDNHLAMSLEWGMPSIKVYTTYKPDLYASPDVLSALLRRTSEGELLMMVHAEDDTRIDHSPHDVKEHSISRPVESERAEVDWLGQETKQSGGFCYVAHVSAGSTVQMVAEKYGSLLGRQLFLESCPHYFIFDDSLYTQPLAPLATMTPPLRSIREVELLRAEFPDIWAISTDHCPYMKAEKAHLYTRDIPMGIGGVEHSFSQMWGLFGDSVLKKFTENPARLQGLWPRKGSLNVGADADIVILDNIPRVIHPVEHSRCDYSLYAGRTAEISARSVLVRGEFVIWDGADIPHRGCFLPRKLNFRH